MLPSSYHWLIQSSRRQRVLCEVIQPLTATQLAKRLRIQRDECSVLLKELALYDLVRCFNQTARRNRIYWITDTGHACQRKLQADQEQPPHTFDFPVVDWSLYGEVCFRHRSAIVRALVDPMQPAEIKRRARARNSSLRMSANNVRDAIRDLREYDVVRPVRVKGAAHIHYELTDLGRCCQFLLRRADV